MQSVHTEDKGSLSRAFDQAKIPMDFFWWYRIAERVWFYDEVYSTVTSSVTVIIAKLVKDLEPLWLGYIRINIITAIADKSFFKILPHKVSHFHENDQ